jgi:hypothetical protein
MHSCDSPTRHRRTGVLLIGMLVLCFVPLDFVDVVFAQSGSLVNPTASQRPGPAFKGGASTASQVDTNPSRASRPVP